MNTTPEGLSRSVQTRLVNHAKKLGVDPNLVLTRYSIERFLYRLSRCDHADRFVLKGALLLLVWLGETIHPTRDADFLGFGDLSDETLVRIFREVCGVAVESDAMVYVEDSVGVTPIRPEDAYGGRRVTIESTLGSARLKVQIDVGIGDVVTPAPTWLDYPSLLGLSQPRLRAYPRETVVAEKFHAMVVLGLQNSRMRDFFDIAVLAERMPFELGILEQAVRATLERRRTEFPTKIPVALSSRFGRSREKQQQWAAFRRKNGLDSAPEDLERVVQQVATFLKPVLAGAGSDDSPVGLQWLPGGPWQSSLR